MLSAQALTATRDVLEDAKPSTSGNNVWSDAELLRHISQQVRGLSRRQMGIDEQYHNCDFHLVAARFAQVDRDVWEYQIPRHIERISNVWERQPLASGVTDDEAPAKTVDGSGNVVVQTRISMPIVKSQDGIAAGWKFESIHSLRVIGYVTAPPMLAQTGKIPARLSKGTIQVAGSNTKRFYLRDYATALTEPDNGEQELTDDAYRNAIFEFTGADDSVTPLSGVVRRCVASRLAYVSGLRRVEITLDRALPRNVAVGDIYDMHMEVPDSSTRLVALLAARAALSKKHNTDGIGAITRELMEQQKAFDDHVAPRMTGGAKYFKPAEDYGFSTLSSDPDSSLYVT